MIWGTKKRQFKIDHVVDLCEGALAYDGALLVGAIFEFVNNLEQEETDDLLSQLQIFQKCLSYGLPTRTAIAVYEMGFRDRVIAQDLVGRLNLSNTQRADLLEELKQNTDESTAVIAEYPLYFQERMDYYLQ